MPRVSGKVAIVTEGSNGLGEAIAICMPGKGAAVAVLDRDEDGATAESDDITWDAVCLALDQAR